ncbi:hypothetical protein [Actinacidiphila glaucinigra]
MGRPEKPVDRTVPALGVLADFLRERRKSAGRTYADMALEAGGMPSAATFKRAASGAYLPDLEAVETFVELTATEAEQFAGDTPIALQRAGSLWEQARRAARARHHVYKKPDPTLIATPADLGRGLRDLHVWAGSPSALSMQREMGPGELPCTTVRRIIAGRTLPVSAHQAVAFLYVCLQTVKDMEPWLSALSRIEFATEKEIDRAVAKVIKNNEATRSSRRKVA